MGLEFLLWFFIVGIFVGSFLNVLIDRIPREQSVVFGRSHCDHCNHKLVWIDLIPVVSFLLLNGKCRSCKKSISIYYPLVEVITGIFFVLVGFIILGGNFLLLVTDTSLLFAVAYFLTIISALIVIFFVDLKYGIIPFTVVFSVLALTAIWYSILPSLQFTVGQVPSYLLRDNSIGHYLLSGLGAFAGFLALFMGTRGRGLGFGDVVYVFFMGFLLGFPNIILGLYIAFLTGAVVSLILVVLKQKKMKGGTIPFGPFLVAGTIISFLWGDRIVAQILAYLLS